MDLADMSCFIRQRRDLCGSYSRLLEVLKGLDPMFATLTEAELVACAEAESELAVDIYLALAVVEEEVRLSPIH